MQMKNPPQYNLSTDQKIKWQRTHDLSRNKLRLWSCKVKNNFKSLIFFSNWHTVMKHLSSQYICHIHLQQRTEEVYLQSHTHTHLYVNAYTVMHNAYTHIHSLFHLFCVFIHVFSCFKMNLRS